MTTGFSLLAILIFTLGAKRRIAASRFSYNGHMNKEKSPLIPFNNTYVHLPERFYERIKPVSVQSPKLIRFNSELARELEIQTEGVSPEELAAIFSGNQILSGSEPIAQAYAGHQFGHFVPQLGDGRAILLGEVVARDGVRRDIQLKGSGQTRFSRQGDGRAALGPVMREYILSEAMHYLKIPTTRSLAMVATGEKVMRETALPGAILTRIAASHIRVGTFEYFAARQDKEALKTLADYVIDRHYPDVRGQSQPHFEMLKSIFRAKAELVANWMRVGFIHGVMNTDNTSVSGETIDYGPCAFMDEYDPATVFSSIDHHGRYAFGNQAVIAAQNMSSLASCLLFLLHEDPAQAGKTAKEAIDHFEIVFQNAWSQEACQKIGLLKTDEAHLSLILDYLELMQKSQADYTLAFRYLSLAVGEKKVPSQLLAVFKQSKDLEPWLVRWNNQVLKQGFSAQKISQKMNAVNPAFIPRNHRVEQAIQAAIKKNDFTVMERLIEVLTRPYEDQPQFADLMHPPKPEERVTQTFCGT